MTAWTYTDRARIYRLEYQEDRDVSFLSSFINVAGMSVLEIPCGAGRLTSHLSQLDCQMVCVDIEKTMIEQLEMTCSEAISSGRVKTFVSDILTFTPDRKFDLIILPRETPQLFPIKTLKLIISRLSKWLVPNTGNLILDMSTFSKFHDPDYYYDQPQDLFVKNWTRGRLTRWSKQIIHADKIEFFFKYKDRSVDDSSLFETKMTLYKHSIAEIVGIFPVDTPWVLFGDYDFSEASDLSPRAILVTGVTL